MRRGVLKALNWIMSQEQSRYTLSAVNANGYTVTAAPQGDQVKQVCGTLTITVTGGEITARTPATTGCW